MKVAVGVLLIAAVAAFLFLRSHGTIPGAEARRLVSEGALLVDVRTPAEYSEGHIDGARNIPIDELESRVGEFGDKATPIVLYCRSGMRSGRGQRLLQGQGFTAVHNLGGMNRWD